MEKKGERVLMLVPIWGNRCTPGSRVVRCCQCGVSCWLSVSGQQTLREQRQPQMVCTRCVLESRDIRTEIEVPDSMMEELRRVLHNPNLTKEEITRDVMKGYERKLIEYLRRNG